MSESYLQFQTYEPEMRTVKKDAIIAAIQAIQTGLEYIRDDLAEYKADPRYDGPERVAYCVAKQEAEIAQMEAALAGLRGEMNITDEKGRPMTYWGGTP
jgi:hypothetical protein